MCRQGKREDGEEARVHEKEAAGQLAPLQPPQGKLQLLHPLPRSFPFPLPAEACVTQSPGRQKALTENFHSALQAGSYPSRAERHGKAGASRIQGRRVLQRGQAGSEGFAKEESGSQAPAPRKGGDALKRNRRGDLLRNIFCFQKGWLPLLQSYFLSNMLNSHCKAKVARPGNGKHDLSPVLMSFY